MIIGIAAFLLLLIALPSFNKILKKFYDSLYSLPNPKKYICEFIIFHSNVYYFIRYRLNFFSYYFSQSLDDGKVIGYDPNLYGGQITGEFRQEYHKLYSYGIFQHIFAFSFYGESIS